MPATRCVLSRLKRFSLNHGLFSHDTAKNLRGLNHVRPLTLTSSGWARSTKQEDEENNEPIKFSTSKANQHSWKVERSMGSHYQRPIWKVLPISLFGIGFLLWCAFREETDIDKMLEKTLYEHLPGFLSDEEKSQDDQDNTPGT
ncbi:ubiquinol-cytochrome-c reductase complex assembly factor 4 [Lampris incognitus]|uniref:ubiquinol-cytochrome-c reductase complex assembly factor 4 n=1 Tax=Lampris incognitus TaxID=2546036 RepID=UPI0024B55AF9|nr:ubiquinol-cytochrome-c reductase complex assembly factor 4 [Lampris incognitus]